MKKVEKSGGWSEIPFPARDKLKKLFINDLQHYSIKGADTLLTHSPGMMVMPLKKCIAMIDYLPARLVQAKKRWYICFYQTDPSTGKRIRHRESFDIGRIPIENRLQAAQDLVELINSRLPYGYPYDEDFYSRSVSMPIKDAFKLFTELSADLRHATVLSYRYSIRKFETYLTQVGLINQEVMAVNKKVALAYSDWLIKQGLKPLSHNNDINDIRRVFNVLKRREIIHTNPFDDIPKKRVTEKERRSLHQDEARTILQHLHKVDKSAYLSCALLYFCLIRPNEQRFLQRKDVNIENNLIHIKGTISKNHKSQTVTIPDQLSDILIDLGINSLAPFDYIIGGYTKIGKSSPVSKSAISNRYREIIKSMHTKGELKNIEGNVLYSWKDTGADGLRESGVDVFTLTDQGRWHSLSQAQTYLSQRNEANKFIKEKHRL